jgi:cysteine desulfurase/selenocysteine lyase
MSTGSEDGLEAPIAPAVPGWDGDTIGRLVNQLYADHPRAAGLAETLAGGVAGLLGGPTESASAPEWGALATRGAPQYRQPQRPYPFRDSRPADRETASRDLPGCAESAALAALALGLPTDILEARSSAPRADQAMQDWGADRGEPRPREHGDSQAADYYFLRPTGPSLAGTGPVTPFDLAGVRAEFPALNQRVHGRPLIWMDNAATTQKPRCVIDTVAQFYARDNSNIHRGAHALAARATETYEGAREKVRALLGATRTEEIVFLRGTTEAINLVAQSWGGANVGPGDEIVLTTMEHHANIVPWQMLCERTGAHLRVAPIDDRGEVILERYAALLGPRTKMVAITQVSNVLGTVNPVEAMTRMAQAVGAKVLIDGAQSVPHFPVDVQAIGCDFFAFSGHKLFGPTGIGVLYGKADLLEEMPPWQGGGMMIADVTFEKTTYNDLPYKFEAGTNHIAGAAGLGAAIDFLGRVDFQAAARHEHAVLAYAMAALVRVPRLRLIGTSPSKVSTLSFVLDGIPNEAVGRHLDRCGIAVRASHHCAQPTLRRYGLETSVRPSLAFYNTCEEVDRLVEAIRQLVR